ncbi:MAG: 50S ribosomal protein L11 methyltransferase [Pseudomonadota bacterium]
MKFKKIMARFDAPDISIAEELICDIFFSFNLKGVVCDIPLEEPDEGFGTHTLPLPEFNCITGFLPLLDITDIQVERIKEQMTALSSLDIHIELSTQIVDENDWIDVWKAYFEVTPITDRITIKPEWKDHTPREGELVIHLDPGMAFGTGTHPTTFMCIQLMDQYLKPGSSFMDVGTGSGILMITAAKLEATSLFGIDTDPIAITIARENLEKNRIDPDTYDLACTTLDTTAVQTFDCVAVNIIAQVIVKILPDIALRMSDQTITVLSGIIRERLPDVLTALDAAHLTVIQDVYENEWVALVVKKGCNTG